MSYSRTTLIVLIMIATWGLTLWAGSTDERQPVASFDRFPVQIGSWQGIRGELDPEIYNVLGVEDYVLANFQKPPFPAINLYIGFYQSQRQGDIIHSPRNCLPGAGWRIDHRHAQVPVLAMLDLAERNLVATAADLKPLYLRRSEAELGITGPVG